MTKVYVIKKRNSSEYFLWKREGMFVFGDLQQARWFKRFGRAMHYIRNKLGLFISPALLQIVECEVKDELCK